MLLRLATYDNIASTMKFVLMYLVALGVPTLLASGCTSSEEEICEAKCDCKGCSDRDFNGCVDDYDQDLRKADGFGCADLYDDWVACQQETYVCRGTDFDTSCSRPKDRFKNCIDD